MKNTKQILAIGMVAAAATGASLLSQVHAADTTTASEQNIAFEMNNFQAEKTAIIDNLKAEIADYVTDTTVKTQAETAIGELEKASDENTFFTKIETVYNTLDSYYANNDVEFPVVDFEGDIEFDMTKDKAEVMAIVKEDISFLEDGAVKSELTTAAAALEKVTDEATFSKNLDALLAKLDAQYETFEENTENNEITDADLENLTEEDLAIFK